MMSTTKVRPAVAASGEGSKLSIKITPAQLRKASTQIALARSVEMTGPVPRTSTKPYARPSKDVSTAACLLKLTQLANVSI